MVRSLCSRGCNPLRDGGAAMISKPGVYEMSAEAYHADPCPAPSLSSSVAKMLVTRTPRHAWAAHPKLNPAFEHEHSQKFDLGSAAHAFMLHDERVFEVIDAGGWTTKDARAMRDGARNANKIPLLTEQWDRLQMMVRSGRRQLEAHQEASGAFTNGKPEQTLIWEERGLWFRARLDWLPNAGDVFDDFKSTAASADPDAWSRIAYSLSFDMQAAFYCRGIKALGLSRDPQFRFIVQEVDSPFALSVIGLSPSSLDLAEHKLARAIEIWRECLKSNRWPGYPDRICYIEPPAWAEAQFIERDARSHDTQRRAQITKPEFDRAMEAQAP